MNTEQTREQKMEAAFLQFIQAVHWMRKRQIEFDTNFGSVAKKNKRYAQERVDNILKDMGINPSESFDFNNSSISFLKERL